MVTWHSRYTVRFIYRWDCVYLRVVKRLLLAIVPDSELSDRRNPWFVSGRDFTAWRQYWRDVDCIGGSIARLADDLSAYYGRGRDI